MMKFVILFFYLSLIQVLFSQNVSDLGKMTFEQVKILQSVSPCETTGNKALRYCSEEGNSILYTFENNKLNGIVFLNAFLTRATAEEQLTKMVNNFTDIVGKKPAIINGMAVFNITDSIMVTYVIKEFQGTYFVVNSSLLTS
jgi:hypothetical protein